MILGHGKSYVAMRLIFYLNVTVNIQNCRIWDNKSSNAFKEHPLHTSNVSVWPGFTPENIIGPFFYENITPIGPITGSVTEEKHRQMLNNFFITVH